MKSKSTSGMWEYLKTTGALDKGDDAIRAAKNEWKKIYNKNWKAEKRKTTSLHVVSLIPAEKRLLSVSAKDHNLGVTEYIKKAALSYADFTYVVHEAVTVRKIEAILIRSFSTLEEISRGENKKRWFSRGNELDEVKKVIATLRTDVMCELTKPDLLMAAVKNNPDKWQDILNLIHDSKDHRS
jgi:hypothetical protein